MKFTIGVLLICLYICNVLGDKVEHIYGDDEGVVYGTEFAKVKLPEKQNQTAVYEFTFPEVNKPSFEFTIEIAPKLF